MNAVHTPITTEQPNPHILTHLTIHSRHDGRPDPRRKTIHLVVENVLEQRTRATGQEEGDGVEVATPSGFVVSRHEMDDSTEEEEKEGGK